MREEPSFLRYEEVETAVCMHRYQFKPTLGLNWNGGRRVDKHKGLTAQTEKYEKTKRI